MYPVLVQLGTFELRSYGVIVALSFLLGLWLSAKEAKRKGLDIRWLRASRWDRRRAYSLVC